MKVTGLDGREYTWNLKGGTSGKAGSSYHCLARMLLHSIFASDQILEELTLPGCRGLLFADFYLPLRRIMVEVQGEQHYHKVDLFQKTKTDFLAGQGRDVKKRQWCTINDISLVELPHWESECEWTERIINAHQNG